MAVTARRILVHVRDLPSSEGNPLTVTVGLPGTFPPIATGPRVWGTKHLVPMAAVNRIAGHVVGWDGFYEKGAPLDCTKHVLLAVIANAPGLRGQLLEAMRDLQTEAEMPRGG